MPWSLNRSNTTKSATSGHKFTISNPIPQEPEPDLNKPTSPLQSHPGTQPSSREYPQSPGSPVSPVLSVSPGLPESPELPRESLSSPLRTGFSHLEKLRRSTEKFWDVDLSSEENNGGQRIDFFDLPTNPFLRTRGDESPKRGKVNGVVSPSIYTTSPPLQPEPLSRQGVNRATSDSPPPPMWKQSSAASAHRQESKAKLGPVHYCIMAVFSLIALTALGFGITAFAEIQSLSKPPLQATHNDTDSSSSTSWQSPSSMMTPTSDVEDGTNITGSTTSSNFNSLETPTTIYSTMTVPKTVFLKPPSYTPTPSTKTNLLLEDREEALVIPPDNGDTYITELNTQTNTIMSTIYRLATRGLKDAEITSSHTSTIISATRVNIAARRFHAPFSWRSIRRQFYDPPHQATPEQSEDMVNNDGKKWVEEVVSVASSNAAVRRATPPWPFGPTSALPIERRQQQLTRKISYWEAYSQLRLQARQLCFTMETYLDSTRNEGDDRMAKTVTDVFCVNFKTAFPDVPQGASCGSKNEWKGLKEKVEVLCKLEKTGKIIVQSVELLCNVKDSLEKNLDECAASGVGKLDVVPETTMRTSTSVAGVPATTTMLGSMSGLSTPNPTAPITPAPLETAPPDPTFPADFTPPTSLILPAHYRLTPPPAWSTVPMLTFTALASYTPSFISPNAAAPPAPYTGAFRSVNLPISYPWPIPTGYVAPHIVPRGHQFGDLTFFNAGIGACEEPAMKETEFALAISWVLIDMGREIGNSTFEKGWDGLVVNGTTGKGSVLCNRQVRLWMGDGKMGEDEKEGRSVEQVFVVRDRCEACRPGDVDIQPQVFERFWANGGKGRLSVTWEWVETAMATANGG